MPSASASRWLLTLSLSCIIVSVIGIGYEEYEVAPPSFDAVILDKTLKQKMQNGVSSGVTNGNTNTNILTAKANSLPDHISFTDLGIPPPPSAAHTHNTITAPTNTPINTNENHNNNNNNNNNNIKSVNPTLIEEQNKLKTGYENGDFDSEALPIPLVPINDPCLPKCDIRDGWKTLPCQECILRGLINGWLRRNDKLKGYQYSRWSRDYCVNYLAHQDNEYQSQRISFSKCFFDQLHVACNL